MSRAQGRWCSIRLTDALGRLSKAPHRPPSGAWELQTGNFAHAATHPECQGRVVLKALASTT